jgi:hypothetical protein
MFQGKSYWITYALCRRLSEKKPTVWYSRTGLYLFVSDGVYVSSQPEPSSLSFQTRILTLLDADARKDIPEFLIGPGSLYLVAFVTSPKAERWKSLKKTTHWEMVLMNPWTRKELSNA